MIPGTRLEDLVHSQPCQATAATLSLIGNKWSVLVMMFLSEKHRRFNELKRLIGGVTQRMLTLTLRDLEREGLVLRTVYPTNPPRVDYELTELGHSLKNTVTALGLWAIRNQPALEAARKRFDARDAADATY